MTYTATITSASLRLRESRIIAGLLLDGVTEAQWRDAIIERNVLQMGSAVSTHRISRLIRARLRPLGAEVWQLIHRGDAKQRTQAVFAGAIKNSRLLGDFMNITMREQRTLFATHLEPRLWTDYIAGCRGRDPDMPHWSDATIARLRSAVFSMLAEAGYLDNTRNRRLQNVYLDSQLTAILAAQGERYVLRCLEITQ